MQLPKCQEAPVLATWGLGNGFIQPYPCKNKGVGGADMYNLILGTTKWFEAGFIQPYPYKKAFEKGSNRGLP